jgi:hypothetical protein
MPQRNLQILLTSAIKMSPFRTKYRNQEWSRNGVRRADVSITFKQGVSYLNIGENISSHRYLVFAEIEWEMYENYGNKPKMPGSLRTQLTP